MFIHPSVVKRVRLITGEHSNSLRLTGRLIMTSRRSIDIQVIRERPQKVYYSDNLSMDRGNSKRNLSMQTSLSIIEIMNSYVNLYNLTLITVH